MRKEELWLNTDVFACQVEKGLVVLARLISMWDKLELSERREPLQRKCSKRSSCKEFSYLVIDMGGPSPLWVVLSLGRCSWVCKKVGEQAGGSLPCGFLLQFLPWCSCPALLWWWMFTWKYQWNKPSSPQATFVHGVYHSIETSDQDNSQICSCWSRSTLREL